MTLKEKLEKDIKDLTNEYSALKTCAAGEFNQDKWSEVVMLALKLHSRQERHRQATSDLEQLQSAEA